MPDPIILSPPPEDIRKARIDQLQARADRLRGKPGYLIALHELKRAKLAALAGGRDG